ncbi:MAG: flagellar motor switch protein FliG [Betaproteobacteria bacterium]
MTEDGVGQAAVLLRSLGEEEAAAVFRHLEPREVQRLGEAMSRIDRITHASMDSVLERFSAEAAGHSPLAGDSPGYVRGVLNKALGDDKARYVLHRIESKSDAAGIESLKWMDAAAVAELVGGEHPQVVASILVHLDSDHAAAVLGHLEDAARNEALLRVATLDAIQPAALQELNETLTRLLAGGQGMKTPSLGGVRAAAGILNRLAKTEESAALEAMRQVDADLAQRILDEMFVFDNLLELEDSAIQLVLREVQSESLVVALKGASDGVRDKVFANMSQRAGEMLRDDLESKGPLRISEVEAEQREVLKIVRRLVEEGQIALGAKAGDAYV